MMTQKYNVKNAYQQKAQNPVIDMLKRAQSTDSLFKEPYKTPIQKQEHPKYIDYDLQSMASSQGSFRPNHQKLGSIQDYEILSDLGTGAYGAVKLVQNKLTKQKVAMKIVTINLFHIHQISKQRVEQYNAQQNISNEIEISRTLNSKYIVQFITTFQDFQNIYIALEYCSRGNLYQIIKNQYCLTEIKAFYYFHQICLAVHYLHLNKVVHRDLKPENILICEDNMIKLCDFNWAQKLKFSKLKSQFCGTIDYMAPEIIKNQDHDEKIDVWSLGVLLFVNKIQSLIFQELLHGNTPFTGKNDQEKCQNILRNNINPFGTYLSPSCISLIQQLLSQQSQNRPSVETIFNHPWMKTMMSKRQKEQVEIKKETQINDKPVLYYSQNKKEDQSQFRKELMQYNSTRLNSPTPTNFQTNGRDYKVGQFHPISPKIERVDDKTFWDRIMLVFSVEKGRN